MVGGGIIHLPLRIHAVDEMPDGNLRMTLTTGASGADRNGKLPTAPPTGSWTTVVYMDTARIYDMPPQIDARDHAHCVVALYNQTPSDQLAKDALDVTMRAAFHARATYEAILKQH